MRDSRDRMSLAEFLSMYDDDEGSDRSNSPGGAEKTRAQSPIDTPNDQEILQHPQANSLGSRTSLATRYHVALDLRHRMPFADFIKEVDLPPREARIRARHEAEMVDFPLI